MDHEGAFKEPMTVTRTTDATQVIDNKMYRSAPGVLRSSPAGKLYEGSVVNKALYSSQLDNAVWVDVNSDAKSFLAIDVPASAAWNTIVEAHTAGVAGDSITIASVEDGTGAGAVTRVGTAFTVHFKDGVTTVAQIEALIAALAGADDLIAVKTPGTTQIYKLLAADDQFAATALAGGIDAAPTVVTADASTDMFGLTTADQLAVPVRTGTLYSARCQDFTATAAVWDASIYVKTTAGTAAPHLYFWDGAADYRTTTCAVTTTYSSCTLNSTTALTAATWKLCIGHDRRDAAQTTTAADTFIAWGAQVELGAFRHQYCGATLAVTKTCNADAVTVWNSLSPFSMNWCIRVGDWTPENGRAWSKTTASMPVSSGTFGAANSFSLYEFGGDIVGVARDAANNDSTITYTHGYSAGSKHNLIFCMNGPTPSLYSDGVSVGVASGTGTGRPAPWSTTLTFATGTYPVDGFVGRVDVNSSGSRLDFSP
jgi:hypothetical protein